MSKKSQDKDYRLTNNRSGASFELKVGRDGQLTIFDEKENVRRAIRHCPNQRSIFIDEQDKHFVISPITFEFGQLTVKANQPLTQEFLDTHPDNGRWFEEINDEKEAQESIEYDELVTDVKTAIRAMAKKEEGIHELSAVVSVIEGSVDAATGLGLESLKRILYNAAESDATYFANEAGEVTIFDDDSIKREYIILRAIKEGIIKKSIDQRSILWTKEKRIIASAPTGVTDVIEYFADFLTSDEGRRVTEEIIKRS